MNISKDSKEFKEIEKIAIEYVNSKKEYYSECIFYIEKNVISSIKEDNETFDFEGIFIKDKELDLYFSICLQLGEKPEYITYIVELSRDYDNQTLLAIQMSKWSPPPAGKINNISTILHRNYDIKKPVELKNNTKLTSQVEFDNSTREKTWGDQGFDNENASNDFYGIDEY